MLALLALLLAAPDPGKALAQRVQGFYAHTKDFSAKFTQRYTYVALGKTDESVGTVEVRKPGLMRWDYAKPEKKTIYIEGKTLWIWQPEDKTAQVKRDFGGDQLSSAFGFLWGKGDLLKEFAPKKVEMPKDLPAGDALELTPLKPVPGVTKLLLVMSAKGEVLASVVTNSQGDVNQIVFSESKIDQGLDASRFHFEPPKDVYVQEF
jgi:outer membrane lipoprotein carrier protein